MTRGSRWAWSVALLAVAAAVPRFWSIGSKDLWVDEAMDLLIATGKCFWDRVAYYLPNLAFDELLAFLTSMGVSHAVLRAVPAAMSVLCVPLVIAISRRYRMGERESLVAGLLLAVSPLQVVYAQEIRPYALVTAFGLAAHLLLLVWIDDRRRAALVGWICVSIVGAFTQGYLVFAGVHLAWILLRTTTGPPENRVAFRSVAAPTILGALVFAASFVASAVHTWVFHAHLSKVVSYSETSPVGMAAYLLGFLFGSPLIGVFAVALAFTGALSWLRQRRANLLVATAAAFVASILAFRAFGSTKFSIRFWVPIQPFFIVLIVAGIEGLRRVRFGVLSSRMFILAWVVAGVVGIVRIHQRPAKDIAAFDVGRDARMLREADGRVAGYLLRDFYALALLPEYRAEWGDRPVYLSSVFPDYLAMVFGNMEPAPCPPSGDSGEKLWVVMNNPVPAHRTDHSFTNDLSPWWGIGAERWKTSSSPQLVGARDLTDEWYRGPDYLREERRVVRWLDSPAGRRTCFVADAWKKARWGFLKHVPGYGLDVKAMTGPPIDPARCQAAVSP